MSERVCDACDTMQRTGYGRTCGWCGQEFEPTKPPDGMGREDLERRYKERCNELIDATYERMQRDAVIAKLRAERDAMRALLVEIRKAELPGNPVDRYHQVMDWKRRAGEIVNKEIQ